MRTPTWAAWFLAKWGYEESKHSMALGDWLLRSGMRTEEQMADLEARVFAQEGDPPYADALGMLWYTMLQEIATFLHYRNLRRVVRERGGDPALETMIAGPGAGAGGNQGRVTRMFASKRSERQGRLPLTLDE